MSHAPRTARRHLALFAAGIVTLGLTGLAGAWKQGGQVPFSLPTGSKPPQPVWQGGKGPRVAVRVRVNSGEVQAQAPVGTPLGTVPANAAAVWEGEFESFTIEGFAPGTSTGFTVLNELATTHPDRLVGAGALTLPLPGGADAFTFYKSDQPVPRLTQVKAGVYAVTVRAGGQQLATVDAADMCFCLKTTQDFELSGQGGTAQFWIYDLTTGAPTWQYGGTAEKQGAADPEDGFVLDGTGSVRITLTNKSTTGQVIITSSHPCTPKTNLGPNEQASAVGPITAFSWAYQGGADKVEFRVANP